MVMTWSEWSREQKISYVQKLPELLTELVKRMEQRADQAEKAVTDVLTRLPLSKKKKGGA